MTSTILVATDGSEAAAAAERFGTDLAKRLKARLLGISVIEARIAHGMSDDGLGVTPPAAEPLAGYLKNRADAVCRRLAERYTRPRYDHDGQQSGIRAPCAAALRSLVSSGLAACWQQS